MKTFLTAIITTAALCAFAPAQNTQRAGGAVSQSQPGATSAQPPAAPGNSALRIAPGSVIPVQLTRTVDAKKVKTGDPVEAKVTQDLKSNHGEVVVPKDTKVIGHVTEAQARNKEQKESQLGIAFDHAVLKNGTDVALPMSIQAIIAPPSARPDNNSPAAESTGAPPPSPQAASSAPGSTGERPSGMATEMPQSSGVPATGGDEPGSGQAAPSARPPITGNTQGVVGISNLKLSPVAETGQPSLVSSDKNNVKLESGTLMLLRVTK